ncbi:hypothetical protein F1721_06900 [Saccharopolyspora hirsuta]|uniref:Uncharacterized protein n=1 Tax=Saccharopolyspora hirsuta TaxID=1837 RepID=A0A5M7C8Q1_SACHI|nr:hypothetical protein [Saccharopolyspora hirsuta]KAA5836061.1 hypothetical protein F1721_06900 [Saccharopolyspora hirsuta]
MPLFDLLVKGWPFILLITVSYGLMCLIWPFKACRVCKGSGRITSRLGRGIRLCPPCEASGLRLRAGRKAWNSLNRLYRANRRNRRS